MISSFKPGDKIVELGAPFNPKRIYVVAGFLPRLIAPNHTEIVMYVYRLHGRSGQDNSYLQSCEFDEYEIITDEEIMQRTLAQ